MRVRDTLIKINPETKRRVYRSIRYPEIIPSENDVYIMTNNMDRLDILAQQYYNDSSLWWIIAHANKIKGTIFVKNGMSIVIPMNINSIIQDYIRINEM